MLLFCSCNRHRKWSKALLPFLYPICADQSVIEWSTPPIYSTQQRFVRMLCAFASISAVFCGLWRRLVLHAIRCCCPFDGCIDWVIVTHSNEYIVQVFELSNLFLFFSSSSLPVIAKRTELCAFSGFKIYPGHGKRVVKADLRVSTTCTHMDWKLINVEELSLNVCLFVCLFVSFFILIKTLIFLNRKCEASFNFKRNPREINWTVLYRRKHKKGQVSRSSNCLLVFVYVTSTWLSNMIHNTIHSTMRV